MLEINQENISNELKEFQKQLEKVIILMINWLKKNNIHYLLFINILY